VTHRAVLLATAILASASACRQPVNTVPPPVEPGAAVQYYDLEVPADVEIRSVDFAATAFAETSGAPGGAVGSVVGGRAFVKVYAVRRGTGEQLLLLYEDIARRRLPVQVIQFHPGSVRAGPDSAR
jgi:hypothetical protein